jgi:hypothetical protein
MRGVFDRAGPDGHSLCAPAVLPSEQDDVVGTPDVTPFTAQCPSLHAPLSLLRHAPRGT